MEVKDVNTTAAALLFNKNAALNASAQAIGAGFANLLDQTVAALDKPTSKPELPAKDKTPAAAQKNEDKPVAEAKEKAPRNDAKKNVSAEAKPVKENSAKNKMKQKPENNAVALAENTSVPSEAKTPVAAEAVAEAAEVATPVSPETTAPSQTPANPIVDDILEANPQLAAVMQNGKFTLADWAKDLSALANMDSVQLLDITNNQVLTVSGADIAEQIENATPGGFVVFKAMDVQPAPQQMQPETVQKQLEERLAGSLDQQISDVLADDAQNVLYDNAELADQAAVLDTKVKADRKLSVEVNVKEEKIAYNETQGLIKDKLTLEQAVKASLSTESDSTPTKAKTAVQTEISVLAQPATGNQTSPAVNLQSAPIIAAQTVAADTVTEGQAVKVTEISAANLGRAAAAGNEFIAARAEAKSQVADTSFRDIYKGMSKEVIDQVKVNITKSAVKGVDKIDISLKPEDLGHIEIKMQIAKDGKLSAHIISSRPETMEVLQKEVQNLQQAFNDAGFATDEGSLSFSFREGNQAGTDRDQNSELRSFIGNVFENETGSDLAGNDNLYNWDPAKGLNIRV